MSFISSTEHAFATAAQDIVKAARFVQSVAIPALKKVAAAEPTIEAITGLVDPQAVNIERTAFAILGKVLSSLDAGAAGDAGMNVTLDPTIVSDLKAIQGTIKAKAAPSLVSVAVAK
jgi:hypothetical protein